MGARGFANGTVLNNRRLIRHRRLRNFGQLLRLKLCGWSPDVPGAEMTLLAFTDSATRRFSNRRQAPHEDVRRWSSVSLRLPNHSAELVKMGGVAVRRRPIQANDGFRTIALNGTAPEQLEVRTGALDPIWNGVDSCVA